MGLAEKLNVSRMYGIMGEKIWNKRRALRLLGSLLPQGCLPGWSCRRCLSFRTDNIFDGKELQAQLRFRLAQQRVAGLFFACSIGSRLWSISLPFFQNCVAFVSYIVLVCKLTLYDYTLNKIIKTKRGPGWCALVDWAPAWKLKGNWFDSQSGHMPWLRAGSPVEDVWKATIHWCFSPSLFHSLPLSLKVNK